ncbi:alpha-mannosidase [Actinoplanes sp. LDG1-06]|uniref:Alpha-mannosidase n=1 Tax=Paractinoplanes ovalisporus TaxID=2810368 RepID=A0ABS2AFN9_9ACTN|nr:glycoside hydrolase family 38 C-terminal domain-containing protein [Actinoplanes ovalisporus]MBM2618590.1 alpha-mannosidase [Actinoplanes ovalisporus]
MHNNDDISIARARRALLERIWPAVHAERIALDVEVSVLPGEPIPPRDAIAGTFEPYRVGTPWGRAWGTTWFRVRAEVPPEWAGRRVEAILDLGFDHPRPGFQCEGLVYRPDGTEVKSVNPQNHWVRVDGDAVDLYVEAASNPVILVGRQFHATWQGDLGTASDRPLYTTRAMDLAVFEPEVHALALDVDVLLGLQGELPEGPRRARVLQALDDGLDLLDPRDIVGSAPAVRERLRPVLESPAEASAHRIAAVGHAHIDSAWLWPVRETERKVARTVSSMLALIEETDSYVFGMSSAQQYDWIRRTRPDLWRRVVDAVRAGRLLPLGGMWVESDTVMPSGESLVRQFLYGQRFFEREFGIRSRGVWLPDSFGYSPALPQLLRRAGFEWFFTQKISWNQTNDFPHHAFVWEGIDGTGVLTHFPPMDTYEAELSGAELGRAARKFRENRIAPASIAPTGHGDGGGGTTREMVGRQQRTADLEGSARVEWRHPDEFFAELATLEDRLPRWSGELYLELHRGTLTTQHAMKQGNRRLEHLLAEAEMWAASANLVRGADYPYGKLDAIWEAVLLNQFHDILPGTSIAWVHREAREQYAELAERAEALIARSLGELVGTGDMNLTARASGAVDPARPVTEPARPREDEDGWLLENDLVRVRVDRRGLITSAVDLGTGRDAVLPGRAANLLQVHDDRPNQWDAWDVDRFYRNSRTDVIDVTAISTGPGVITVDRPLSAVSRVRQTISLDGRVVRLEQETHWNEDERFLKLSFPLDVRAEQSVAETQFGVVSRPTHTNTSWEDAQFETSMHRFVLVEEPGFGVAVVNESSHGYDITRVRSDHGWGVDLRLSLLRAPIFPDPGTDRGFHRHEFGLVIGADITGALRAATALGHPDRPLRGARTVEPIVRLEGEGLAISTVKAAADRSGDIIVRLHEHTGARARGRLILNFPAGAARTVTLLEEPLDPGRSDLAVELGPFEVQTWRITPAPAV